MSKTEKVTKGITSFIMEGGISKKTNAEPEMTVEEVREKEKAKRFDDIMHQLSKAGHAQEMIDLPIELLTVDATYQIPERTERNLSRLIAKWDMNKLMPILVVPHPEEKRFAIVDGTGRVTASQRITVPLNYIRSMAVMTAPSDVNERRKFEAELYAFQDVGSDPVKPAHKHGANLILGDRAAIAIDRMEKKYGITFTSKKGQRSYKTIGSYSALYNIAKTQGEECLDWAFSVLNKAGFDRKDSGYSDAMLRSLRDMWMCYHEEKDKVAAVVVDYLRPITHTIFKGNAVSKYPILDYKMAMSFYLEDVVTSKLAITKRRKINEKNRVVSVESVEASA